MTKTEAGRLDREMQTLSAEEGWPLGIAAQMMVVHRLDQLLAAQHSAAAPAAPGAAHRAAAPRHRAPAKKKAGG